MLISWLWLDNKLAQLFLLLDSALYQAVSWLYSLFLKIAQTEIFSNSVYENFAQRVYVVLGVVMLFVLAYSLLTAIVNPDNLTKGDKSMSKVATKLVTSLIIIGLLPTVFDYAHRLQNFILDQNLIGVLLFGSQEMDVEVNRCDENGNNCTNELVTLPASEVSKARINNYGSTMALTTLNAFLNPENVNIEYDASDYLAEHGLVNGFSAVGCGVGGVLTVAGATAITYFSAGTLSGITLPSISTLAIACFGAGAAGNAVANNVMDVKHYTWDDVRLNILLDRNGGFSQIISLADVLKDGAKDVDTGNQVEITYMAFISSLAAGVLIYLLVSFCIDLGIRTIRLAFLQLIAPIPIFMRALPGKGTQFDKWLKKTIATYLEVFVRVFLMYMVVYFLSNIHGNLNTREGLWVNVILIMGLFAFVKEAPKLIADITGIDSGNMKLGILPKLAAGGALTGAALVGGGVTAGVKGLTSGINNAVKSWKDPSANVFKKATGVLSGFGGGILNAGTGLISGGARGAYSGRSAKNLADMRKAAKAGAQGAVDARGRRESYRAAHAGNVAGAQIKDAWTNAMRWAGISNVDAMKADQKILQEIFAKRKAAADAAESEVMKKAGERIVSAGKEVTSSTGDVYRNLSELDNVIELMKNKGVDAHGGSLNPADLSKQLTELQNLRTKLKDNLVDDYINGYDITGTTRSASNILGPVKENLAAFNTLLKNNMSVVNSHLSQADLSDPTISGWKSSLETYINQTRDMKIEDILGNDTIDLANAANNAKKLVGTSNGNLGTQINTILQRENSSNSGGGSK